MTEWMSELMNAIEDDFLLQVNQMSPDWNELRDYRWEQK